MDALDRLLGRFPTLLMAYRNLTRTKVRTGLAALGIVIGVVAIASLGMFGATLRSEVTDNLGDIGNQVQVYPGEDKRGGFDTRDIERIRQTVGDQTVVPAKTATALVIFMGRAPSEQRTVTGMENPAEVYSASEGRIPDPLRSGVVVGADVAEEHDLSPGSTVTIDGITFRVRAIIDPDSGLGAGSTGNLLIAPPSEFHKDEFDYVTVSAESGQEANETAIALREEFNDREEKVRVEDFSKVVDEIQSSFRVLNGFLIGIGSISLLVAGVSILNVMLMSTIERREEIGVLRAVGFQQRDILRVMLSEAALLGAMGGAVGVVLSVVAGLAINHFVINDVMATFRLQNLPFILLGFAFGVFTSVVSGIYPAWKAARERPVEALRS